MNRSFLTTLRVAWRTFAAVALVYVALAANSSTVQAEPIVASMFPPSIVRGQTTLVTLRGEELHEALDLWSSLPTGALKAKRLETTPDVARFEVAVAADAPIGLHGVRLATDDGLSNAIIVLVDDLPVSVAAKSQAKGFSSSSNGSISSENRIAPITVSLPIAMAGTFAAAHVDRYQIEVAAGEEVSFECVASRLGKDADPLLRVRDGNGRVVVERDNDAGLFFDFRFSHRFAAAGRYTVELCDARFHGEPDWNYILRMGKFPTVRVAVPSSSRPGEATQLDFPEQPGIQSPFAIATSAALGRRYHAFRRPGDTASTWVATSVSDAKAIVEIEPNNLADQATMANTPALLCGVLDRRNDIDCFAFELKKGERLHVRAEASLLDSPADIELAAIGPDGRELQRIDDVLLEEPSLVINANRDGPYRVLIHDVTRDGGPAFAYRVEVRRAGPQLALVADFSSVTLPQGEYQALPLALTRTEYTGPVELSLLGAPAGVTLEPSVIPEGQNALIAKIKADKSAPLGLATMQVVAKATVNDTQIMAVARTQPLIDRERYNVDLIKYSLRENQRRLPPSLSNQIALQVTPPAPFGIELPESLLTLVRFLSVDLPIHSTRANGFAGPLTFKAKGGQIGEESEIRRQIYVRIEPAKPEQLKTHGTFYSRNLPNEAKDRIDLTSTGEVNGREVKLVRSFDLDLKAAFDVKPEPSTVTCVPGETVKFQLMANRVAPFDGPVTIEPVETPGLVLPEKIVIPAGAPSVEVSLAIPADFMPRRLRIRFPGSALVGKFVEDGRPKELDLDVKKPDPKLVEKK